MLIKFPLEEYLIQSERGWALTTAFYNLSLADKYQIVYLLEENGLIHNYKLYERVVKAILQHSSPEIKSERSVKGERKQRPEANRADMLEALNALALHWDDLEEQIIAYFAGRFQNIVAANQ